MPFPRTQWEERSKVNMLNLWICKSPNLLVGTNPSIENVEKRGPLNKGTILILRAILRVQRIRLRPGPASEVSNKRGRVKNQPRKPLEMWPFRLQCLKFLLSFHQGYLRLYRDPLSHHQNPQQWNP